MLTCGAFAAAPEPAPREQEKQSKDPAPRDSAVGPVRFNAPKGWLPVLQPDRNVRVYSAPTTVDGEEASLIISVGSVSDPDDFNFRERFDEFVNLTLKGLEPRRRGTPRAGKTSDGVASLTQQLWAENAAGKETVAKCVAFDLTDRLAGFSLLASSQKVFKEYERAFDQVTSSASIAQEARAARTADREDRSKP
jgi:hypothetical protein